MSLSGVSRSQPKRNSILSEQKKGILAAITDIRRLCLEAAVSSVHLLPAMHPFNI